jgi:signal peptidase I
MSTAPQMPDTAPPTQARTSAPHRQDSSWLSSVQSLMLTIVIAIFVITFLVQAFQIPSESMENTLLIGDYLLVDKEHFGSAPWLGRLLPYEKIKRNDIIVFRYPVNPEQHFVKRVIGMPGDRIKLIHGNVLVNGIFLNEPYVIRKRRNYNAYRDDFPSKRYADPNVDARWWGEMGKLIDEDGQLIVPQNNYFVLGDNREDSLDSRYWGFVPRENVLGRPMMIYFSVHQPNEGAAQDDKLLGFAYTLGHIADSVRWHRCFRMVF